MLTLNSLLCAQKWWWDSSEETYIRFYEDGTGELVARSEFSLFIAAHFDWKPHGPYSLSSEIDITGPWLPRWRPCDVGEVDIEMTLTTRRVQMGTMDMEQWTLNEYWLTDEAFVPKKLTLRLEKGKFMGVSDYPIARELPCYKTYQYRLSCDPSPFPPRHMWKESFGSPATIRFWEWSQFQSHGGPIQWQTTLGKKIFTTCKRAMGWD